MHRLVFDGHLDLAMNAVHYSRDLARPVDDIRRREGARAAKGPGTCTVTLPAMVEGGVFACAATLFARVRRRGVPGGWRDVDRARAATTAQLRYYDKLQAAGLVEMIRFREDLARHWKAWRAAAGREEGKKKVGIILLMECADPLRRPEELNKWVKRGVRAVGPAHIGPNRYAHGTGAAGGLTPRGRRLLQEMERLGVALDASHLSDEAFWEAVRSFTGPVMASHSNSRALCDGSRQLDDRQIAAIVSRGGIVGIALDIRMLSEGSSSGPARLDVGGDRVADHIDRVCQIAGDALHVGLGSDLDGGFGRERIPNGFDSIADLGRLADALLRRGYRSADVESVLSGNWLRFWNGALPGKPHAEDSDKKYGI